MNRTLTPLFALIAAAAFVTTAAAQGRHDERPHGYNPQVATAKATTPTCMSATGGRHDEKPHGCTGAPSVPTAKATTTTQQSPSPVASAASAESKATVR